MSQTVRGPNVKRQKVESQNVERINRRWDKTSKGETLEENENYFGRIIISRKNTLFAIH